MGTCPKCSGETVVKTTSNGSEFQKTISVGGLLFMLFTTNGSLFDMVLIILFVSLIFSNFKQVEKEICPACNNAVSK